MTKLRLLLLFCLFTFFSFAQIKDTSISLYFPINEHVLPDAELQKLQEFLDAIPLDRILRTELMASCDAPGSTDYNKALGERRLNFVKDQLPQILSDSLKQSLNLGDQGLEGKKYTEQLRRVDVNIRWKDQPGINALFKQLSGGSQEFKVNCKKDTVLLCENGTQIYIPENAFEKMNSKKPVIISVTEALSVSDMLINRLTTTSNGRLLETGGMIKISANQDGKALRVRKSKEIGVLIPRTNDLLNPQLFAGRHHGDSINWRPNGQVTDGNPGIWQFIRCSRRYAPCNFWCRLSRSVGLGGPQPKQWANCSAVSALFIEYGAKDLRELKKIVAEKLAYRRPIRSNYQLWRALNQLRKKEAEERLENGSASASEVQYYLFSTGTLGWINVDSFSDMDPNKLTDVSVPISPLAQSNVQMVFTKRRSILPANWQTEDGLYFKDIPLKEETILVATQYIDAKIYVALQEYTIGDEVLPFEFEEVDLEGLKEIWKKLN